MRVCVTLGALALGVALAVPAQAQFKLPKPKIKLPGSHAAAAATGGAEAAPLKPGRVQFDERVLEITPERLARFERALAAEQEVADRMKGQDLEKIEKQNEASRAAYDKAFNDYQKKQEKYDACAEPIRQRLESESEKASADANEQFKEADMQKIAARIQAAQQRGDMKEVQRLADSVSRAARAPTAMATAAGQSGSSEIRQKCGQPPVEPAQPTIIPTIGGGEVRSAGRKASGMDDGAYAVMRERIAAWVLSHGNANGYAYTAGELSALKDHADKLAGYEELFRAF